MLEEDDRKPAAFSPNALEASKHVPVDDSSQSFHTSHQDLEDSVDFGVCADGGGFSPIQGDSEDSNTTPSKGAAPHAQGKIDVISMLKAADHSSDTPKQNPFAKKTALEATPFQGRLQQYILNDDTPQRSNISPPNRSAAVVAFNLHGTTEGYASQMRINTVQMELCIFCHRLGLKPGGQRCTNFKR
jgi:hypothetical protein